MESRPTHVIYTMRCGVLQPTLPSGVTEDLIGFLLRESLCLPGDSPQGTFVWLYLDCSYGTHILQGPWLSVSEGR